MLHAAFTHALDKFTLRRARVFVNLSAATRCGIDTRRQRHALTAWSVWFRSLLHGSLGGIGRKSSSGRERAGKIAAGR